MNDELKIEILELNEVVDLNVIEEESVVNILVNESNAETNIFLSEIKESIEIEVCDVQEIVCLIVQEIGIKGDSGIGANEANEIRNKIIALENEKHLDFFSLPDLPN